MVFLSECVCKLAREKRVVVFRGRERGTGREGGREGERGMRGNCVNNVCYFLCAGSWFWCDLRV